MPLVSESQRIRVIERLMCIMTDQQFVESSYDENWDDISDLHDSNCSGAIDSWVVLAAIDCGIDPLKQPSGYELSTAREDLAEYMYDLASEILGVSDMVLLEQFCGKPLMHVREQLIALANSKRVHRVVYQIGDAVLNVSFTSQDYQQRMREVQDLVANESTPFNWSDAAEVTSQIRSLVHGFAATSPIRVPASVVHQREQAHWSQIAERSEHAEQGNSSEAAARSPRGYSAGWRKWFNKQRVRFANWLIAQPH